MINHRALSLGIVLLWISTVKVKVAAEVVHAA